MNFIRLLILTLLMIFPSIYAQKSSIEIDTQEEITYGELIGKIKSTKEKDVRLEYAYSFLKKAKNEKNSDFTLAGYEMIAGIKFDLSAIPYLDTVIDLTKSKPNNFYPSQAYINKGNIYYNALKNKEALNHFLIAQKYLLENPNKMLEIQNTHGIGILKNRIGDFRSSLELHKKNLNYYKKNTQENNIDHYLNTIFSVTIGYSKLNIPDSARIYNRKGVELARKYNRKDKSNLFILSEGVLNNQKKNFKASLDSIKLTLSTLIKTKDKTNLLIAYNYIADNLWKLNNHDEALSYFKKVDSLYVNEEILVLEVRNSYRYLSEYYESRHDDKSQLAYLKKMIKIDSLLYKDKELGSEISLKFDIPKLIAKRDNIILKLENHASKLNKYLVTLVPILIVLVIIIFWHRNLMKRRFKRILLDIDDQSSINQSTKNGNDSKIPENIVLQILKNLEIFEESKGFTDSDLTLTTLSREINSNSTYVSKVINSHKEKNFSDYIKGLRVQLALKKLKHEPSFRKYTIEAISSEVGFKSAETFSKFFKSYTGIYPSYFIKQLEASLKKPLIKS